MRVYVSDQAATEAFGAQLAQAFAGSGALVFLHGPLGAGKTTLVRGLLRAYGHSGAVRSPTYTLIEEYHLPTATVLHLDLYRLGSAEELDYLGLREQLNGQTLVLIEWPERGTGWLPSADLGVCLDYADSGRQIELQAHSALGESVIAKLRLVV